MIGGELVAYGVTMAFTGFMVGHMVSIFGEPFTAAGRAAWRYKLEVSRRAARLIALGIDPDDARKAAVAEMRGEADESLKAEGAIKELLR